MEQKLNYLREISIQSRIDNELYQAQTKKEVILAATSFYHISFH